jgi:hypothetical protein
MLVKIVVVVQVRSSAKDSQMGVSVAEKDAKDNKLGSGPVVGVDCDSEVDSRFGNQNYCDGYTKGYMGEANKLTAK